MAEKLTKRAVDAASARETMWILWDTELKGFGLAVHASGVKAYVVRYRTASGRDRRMTLGRHGELTPNQARHGAADQLAQVRAGVDPLEDRDQRRHATTVFDLVETYRRRHLAKRKASTKKEYERILEKEILPTFGRRALDDITASDVAKWHAAFKRPYIANRALALLRSLFELAARWNLRDPARPNPCSYVERNRERSRERFLSDGELARFGEALEGVAAEVPKSRPAVAALRLLLLTGARRNEILQLRWEYLDGEHFCAWLPDSKTGKRPLLLSGPAWDVFESVLVDVDIRPREGWVFPSARKPGTPIQDLRKTFATVCKRADLDRLRLHDLRHSHASAAAGEGLSLPLIGKLLGHKRASTTERYAHLADDPVRHAASLVQARLAERMARRPSGTDGALATKSRYS